MLAKRYRQIPSGMEGVDLWLIDLALPAEAESACLAYLSDAERGRAALLERPATRRRFLAARSALRRILAEYRDESPGALALTEGAAGKPALPGGPCFNLSHTEDLGVCAIAAERRVGVDVERLRPIPHAERIVRRWFSPAELRSWTSQPPNRRAEAFLRMWTRQEAYLKALGIGLPALEQRLRVDLRGWELRELSAGDRYVGALVAERLERRAG